MKDLSISIKITEYKNIFFMLYFVYYLKITAKAKAFRFFFTKKPLIRILYGKELLPGEKM